MTIGDWIAIIAALGGGAGFGLFYFATKREVELLEAEIIRMRDRIHKMPGEVLALLDRKEHGDE